MKTRVKAALRKCLRGESGKALVANGNRYEMMWKLSRNPLSFFPAARHLNSNMESAKRFHLCSRFLAFIMNKSSLSILTLSRISSSLSTFVRNHHFGAILDLTKFMQNHYISKELLKIGKVFTWISIENMWWGRNMQSAQPWSVLCIFYEVGFSKNFSNRQLLAESSPKILRSNNINTIHNNKYSKHFRSNKFTTENNSFKISSIELN